MHLRSAAAVLVAAPILVIAGAGAASAGEVTGPPVAGFATGGPTGIWGHANSECAFSGLNAFHPGKQPTQVQNYGNFVKRGLKDQFPSPGVACNGHLSPMDWSNTGQ
jgi:hypothetical protein